MPPQELHQFLLVREPGKTKQLQSSDIPLPSIVVSQLYIFYLYFVQPENI